MLTEPTAASPGSPDRPRRPLLIVLRGESKLYEYVRRTFVEYPEVEVIQDRRVAERRQEHPGADLGRRRADRRGARRAQEQLRSRGWVLVHRPGDAGR
jgi:hypothetical protein